MMRCLVAVSTSKGTSTAGRKVSKQGHWTLHFLPSGGVTWLTHFTSLTLHLSPKQRVPADAPLTLMR